MPSGEELDVTAWRLVGDEPMGEPGKRWLEEPMTERRWLFKPIRYQRDARGAFPQGDDWAEKIGADVAALIGLPVARVELARRDGVVGALSRDVAHGARLSLGNELMTVYDPAYPAGQVGTVSEYTLDRIFTVLEAAGIAPAIAAGPSQSAASLFAGYLVLDAWIANQDRHHGNWGVLEDLVHGSAPQLAPSFDHGSSLGLQLHEDKRRIILERDGVQAWARRGLCRPMAGKPNLVALALDAVRWVGQAAEVWLERLSEVRTEAERSVVGAIPGGRMSQPSRTFAEAVLAANRKRLLDGN